MLKIKAYKPSWNKRNYDQIQKQTFAAENVSAIDNGVYQETTADDSTKPCNSSKQLTGIEREACRSCVINLTYEQQRSIYVYCGINGQTGILEN
jgi:hypothetical protein